MLSIALLSFAIRQYIITAEKGTLVSGVDFSVSTTRSHSTQHRCTMRLTEIAC